MRSNRNRSRTGALGTRRGATTVEFALVAPILFLFVFGIIEASRAVMVKHAMNNAAREGCREASLVTTISSSDVDTAVRNALQSTIPAATDSQKVQVTVTPATLAGLASGTDVSVTIDVNFADMSWLPGSFLGMAANTTLSAEASQERE